MNRLCPDCQNARDRWIYDSGNVLQHIRQPGIQITEFATYDGTPEGIAWRRRAKTDDYYALVRRQLALIDDICARTHRVAPGIEPISAVPGQTLDLFGEAA